MSNPFRRATKKRSKLRLAIDGPSGSGKTWTSLVTAEALAEGGRIAVIDTEHGSASLYSDRFDFDVLELHHYDPAKYVEALHAAERAGYQVVVIDSLSHAWQGDGGVMDIVDRNAKGGNSWSGWAKGTPAYRSLVDAILASPIHVIATMRTKTEWVLVEGKNGKQKPEKIGTAPVMRDGIDYEFTVVADMDLDHVLTVSKSRCTAVADRSIRHPDGTFGRELLAWLNDGGDPAPVEPEVWVKRWASAVDRAGVPTAEAVLDVAGVAKEDLGDDVSWTRYLDALKAALVPETPAALSPSDASAAPSAEGDPYPHAPLNASGSGDETARSSAPDDSHTPEDEVDDPRNAQDVISQPQLKRLAAIANELGLADEEWKAIACHVAGVTSRKDIPRDRYEAVEAAMREAVESAQSDAATMAVAGEGA